MIFLTFISMAVYEYKKYMKPKERWVGDDPDNPVIIWEPDESMYPANDSNPIPLLDDLIPPLPDPDTYESSSDEDEYGRPKVTYAYCPPVYREWYYRRFEYDVRRYREVYGVDFPEGKDAVCPSKCPKGIVFPK